MEKITVSLIKADVGGFPGHRIMIYIIYSKKENFEEEKD